MQEDTSPTKARSRISLTESRSSSEQSSNYCSASAYEEISLTGRRHSNSFHNGQQNPSASNYPRSGNKRGEATVIIRVVNYLIDVTKPIQRSSPSFRNILRPKDRDYNRLASKNDYLRTGSRLVDIWNESSAKQFISTRPGKVFIGSIMLFFMLLIVAAKCAAAEVPLEGVPGPNTVISGDYSGALRPQIHFSAPQNFLNDPNGCFRDANGTWHLYYQYNPTAPHAGNQHWGHATSKDLYHWENQPIAIYANEAAKIFSGSAVVDVNNTSGFFPNQTDGVVAIYTAAMYNNTLQRQHIAYSTDGGYHFENYTGNPVLDIGAADFRDPKVIWHAQTSKWIMVLAHAKDIKLSFWASDDLKKWEEVSSIENIGWVPGNFFQYECPNLVEIQTDKGESTWVLVLSINPGAPQGGSFTQFFPGSFNGTHFEPDTPASAQIDWGKDNYAGQFFYDAKDPANQKPVIISWMNNWDYCNQVPTGARENWASVMGLPRETSLKKLKYGWGFASPPVDMSGLYGKDLLSRSIGNGTAKTSLCGTSGAVHFQANFTTGAKHGKANFTFSNSDGEHLTVGISLEGDGSLVYVNRGNMKGIDNDLFTNVASTRDQIDHDGYSIYGVFDRSIIEVFTQEAEESGSMVFYPKKPLTDVTFSTHDLTTGEGATVKIVELKSTWQLDQKVDVCSASLGGSSFNKQAANTSGGSSDQASPMPQSADGSRTQRVSIGSFLSAFAITCITLFFFNF